MLSIKEKYAQFSSQFAQLQNQTIMKQNLQQQVNHIRTPLGLMDIYNQQKQPNLPFSELDFIQSFLSWSSCFQRPLSDQDISLLKSPQSSKNAKEIDSKQAQNHEPYKKFEKTAKFDLEPTVQLPCDLNATSLNLMNEELDQNSKRIKDEIKTFPSFIFRTFSKHLIEHEHFYSEKDGVKDLKKYLKDHFGAKHYTLEQLENLFKLSSLWNCKLNRLIMCRILADHSYKEIFSNSQRKKKKTYLIMTKVFKLRCKSVKLCSRVQCQ